MGGGDMVCHTPSLVIGISYSPRFGEESVEKTVNQVLENVPLRPDLSVLEVGSGNGTLLFALVKEGYAADRLVEIDYSEGAVSLASSISKTRCCEAIRFNRSGFLKEEPPLLSDNQQVVGGGAWDQILDKGTFDAIVLMQTDDNGKSLADDDPSRVAKLLLQPGAYFLITCKFGWTQYVDNYHVTQHATSLRPSCKKSLLHQLQACNTSGFRADPDENPN